MTTASPAELTITGGAPLRGRLRLPGCKGISHRALLFAAIADGTSRITNLAPGDDVARTRAAIGALGVPTSGDGDVVEIAGTGCDGIDEPDDVIDCGNSGTTLRLLAGLLAGRPHLAVLTGDASLRGRPMGRVVRPLRALGALVDGAADAGRAPLTVRGGGLVGERVELEVASGQVKTALVLAGLQAGGVTEIIEPEPSRDHTERMLGALGAPLERLDPRTLRVRAGSPGSFDLEVPGDPSSAAFFVVAAAIVPGSAIVIEGMSLNPGRVEYLDVLRVMGAQIEARVTDEVLGEPVGDVTVEAAPLHGTEISSREAIVDELPVLAVAAAFAEGVTEIRDAAELAVKESNRITTVQQELSRLGIAVEPQADGLVVRGGAPRGARMESHGDHRIAMAAAVAATGATGGSTISGWDAVAVSYPGFADDLERLRDPSRGGDDHRVTDDGGGAQVVAIDGPSGSGKSTVARGVGEELGLRVLDTGAMYRAVTVAALEAGIDLTDAELVGAVAANVRMEVEGTVLLDGHDVSAEIRAPGVTASVSTVSAHPGVRRELVARQRAWVATHGGGVVEGRDIGTVVFPAAPVKVYLEAGERERARRRQRDEAAADRDVAVDDVRDALARRDAIDTGRAASPLRVADDAIVIDATHRSVDEIVTEIVTRFRAATEAHTP